MEIKNVEDLINKTNIRAFVHTSDIVKGKYYPLYSIDLVGESLNNQKKLLHYEVESESKPTYYDVYINLNERGDITRTLCDCKQYQNTQSCKHIAAVFIQDYVNIFQEFDTTPNKISDLLLDKFIPKEDNIIKKELNVSLNITFKEVTNRYYFYGNYIDLNIKISVGENKLYALKNHLRDFKRAYKDGVGEVYFGKSFVYDASKYYASANADKILNAYFDYIDMEKNRYNHEELKLFLSRLKDVEFVVNNYEVKGIIEGFPIDVNMIKNNNDYELSFDLDNMELLISNDYEYIFYKGCLYHLKKLEQELIEELVNNKLNKLVVKKENVGKFTKGLLNVIRGKLSIDDNINDLVLPSNIKSKLYFDIRSNYIECKVVFSYDLEEVDYFIQNNNVLRDSEYENKVINDLVVHGFLIENKKIILEDLEKEVEFLENGLEELASKYEVFTTEKFKNVNIKKKTNISSMFSIGKDNILSYDFSLGSINSDELVNIFKSLKDKKKYYRLKNGDILSLQDEALKELSDLSDDLELSDDDIRKGRGSILKYRAIYLDSLKNTKYNIINTNNLFQEFIDKFYKYKDVKLVQSNDELKVLRDYQLTGVKWLKTIDKTGFGGILADEMGLGKTIQVIYYIKEMLKEDNYKFLIVVPTSLAYNWAHEFSEFGSGVDIVLCIGNKQSRINEINKESSVYITTYGLLREDEEYYKDMNFHAVIIDEAQTIKNNHAAITKVVKSIKSDVKFALTGTPLENSILELWSIFDFIMPGYLASLTKFQSKYKIKDYDEDSEVLLKGLSKQINPFILRRKKKDVIKELPDKLINDIYIDLDPEDKKLYVAELERVRKEMEEVINEEDISKARFLILQLLTKLRQICISPSIIYEDYKSDSSKIVELERLVAEYIKNEHKILIFSSFKRALNLVKERLEKSNIKVFMIDGSVPSKLRMDLVTEFNQNDDVKVFLVMLKSGGTGLNLTAADVVIHLDLWWNPQAENQATDRAHRIGQKNTVEVIHLITKGTIEEKILELQNKKRILSDKLIDGEVRDKNILSSLTKEDIENLLSYENKD